MINEIDHLLHPRRIALVGVSGEAHRMGALPLKFLVDYGFSGTIYPVNPRYPTLGGLPCFPSIAALPEPVDLMVISVNAERVMDTLEDCAPGQVHCALVLTSGYAEMGPEGKQRQDRLLRKAHERGIRLCGPNSVGIANLWDGVVPTISQAFDQKFRPGPVAFISQSGALGTAVMALAAAQGISVGYFISSGNEADWDFTDYAQALLEDPRVQVIAGYVEGLRDGRRLASLAARARELGKPIVLLKVGQSAQSAEAARSHTGALTGSDEVYQAVFDHYGIVRVPSIEALLDCVKVLMVRPAWGRRIGIVGHSGGAGVMMTDEAARWHLHTPPTSDTLRSRLAERLPAFASLNNPVDMTANVIFDPDVMLECLEAMLNDPAYDVGVFSVNLMWRIRDALAQGLIDLKRRTATPFVVSWIGVQESLAGDLQRAGIPTFPDPVRTIAALGRLTPLYAPPASAPPPKPRARKSCPDDPLALLNDYDMPVAPHRWAASWSDAVEAARVLGFPLVAKIVAPDLIHKSDAGGVFVNIRTENALADAWSRLQRQAQGLREAKILIQSMIANAVEVLVGARWDPVFGGIVVLGLGGIYTEILHQTDIRLAPLTTDDAMKWIMSQPWHGMLSGARGQEVRDIESLAGIIAAASRMIQEQAIEAIDFNPVMVCARGHGAWIADWRFLGVNAV